MVTRLDRQLSSKSLPANRYEQLERHLGLKYFVPPDGPAEGPSVKISNSTSANRNASGPLKAVQRRGGSLSFKDANAAGGGAAVGEDFDAAAVDYMDEHEEAAGVLASVWPD